MNNKLTRYQEWYYAWDLNHRKSISDDSKFTGVLSEARVDLNPHQVDAALFAFNSPFREKPLKLVLYSPKCGPVTKGVLSLSYLHHLDFNGA